MEGIYLDGVCSGSGIRPRRQVQKLAVPGHRAVLRFRAGNFIAASAHLV